MTRKHTRTTVGKYPKKYELCENQFVNSIDFKHHIKTHSYKEAKFKWDCDFVGKSKESLEVHEENWTFHGKNFSSWHFHPLFSWK